MDRFTAMETFISVIETGSFSGGARRMKVGQPAVSKTVAQLESRLGVRLFVRTTRGLTPTEAGQRFYERAKSAIEAADDAELQARGEGAGLTGMLRVCAGVTFARLHLVPAIPGFLAQHPGLRLDVVLDDRKVDLLEEGIDVALRMGGVREPGAMTARKIAESPRLVLGTPTYFAAAGVPGTPADLRTHESVIYDQRVGGTDWEFKRGRVAVDVTVSGRLRISAAEGVRAAVLAHAGFAIASEWMFAPELKSGSIRAVLTEWTLPPIGLWAVFPAGRLVSAKARTFVMFVEETLRGAGAPTQKRIPRRAGTRS
jgi:DNA-binding transcriptional LysR family regulator